MGGEAAILFSHRVAENAIHLLCIRPSIKFPTRRAHGSRGDTLLQGVARGTNPSCTALATALPRLRTWSFS